MDYTAIYIIAAVAPAALLMYFVYKKDKVEKEPMNLLWRLVLGGCAAAVLSGILETFGMGILDTFVNPESPIYTVLLAFLVVAVIEEGTKYFFLKRRSWNHPAFDYTFDGIVYAVFVSLGFAALENIGYVFGYGLEVAPMRALLAIPGHMGFAVFMGFFYGRAKLWERRGYPAQAASDRLLGYLIAVFMHGFYDTCAMLNTELATIVFFIFVIIMDIIMLSLVSRGAKEDEPL